MSEHQDASQHMNNSVHQNESNSNSVHNHETDVLLPPSLLDEHKASSQQEPPQQQLPHHQEDEKSPVKSAPKFTRATDTSPEKALSSWSNFPKSGVGSDEEEMSVPSASGIIREHKKKREFNVNDRSANLASKFPTNYISTSKYTLWNFLFLFLWEQFRRFANFVFLVTILLQLVPGVSPVPVYVVALPFLILLGFAGVKEVVEDIVRHREDWKQNRLIYRRIDGHKAALVKTKSRNIQVGDIIRVKKNEFFPCDVIILASSNADNFCYVDTANLDGETAPKGKSAIRTSNKYNLKDARDDFERQKERFQSQHRQSERSSSRLDSMMRDDLDFLSQIEGKIEATAPIAKFSGFEGAYINPLGERFAISDDQLVLRGCKLSNTEFVYGIVYATGKETKIQLNKAAVAAYKFSTFEVQLNRGILLTFSIEVLVSLITAIANSGITTFSELEKSAIVTFLEEFVTAFILFSFFVPMSLFFTIEIIRIGWGRRIQMDPAFRVAKAVAESKEEYESDGDDVEEKQARCLPQRSLSKTEKPEDKYEYAQVKTNAVIEDLGRVQYLFSDKTGTLTQNIMSLRCCSIAGIEAWNTALTSVRAELDNLDGVHKTSVGDLVRKIFDKKSDESKSQETYDEETLRRVRLFFYTLLVCHEVLILDENSEPDALSPDELAFVRAMAANGLFLLRSNDQEKVIGVKTADGDYRRLTFKILSILKFSADRKRMTVVVEDPDGHIFVLSKGADAVLHRYLHDDDSQHWTYVEHFTSAFASEGNRTLVMLAREISKDVYEDWQVRYREASTAVEHRAKKVEQVFQEMERDMDLLGCTAVEDQLQEGTPEAVESLLQAGIVVVMLTGDKQETAMSIGRSSRIIPEGSTHVIVSAESKRKTEYLLNKIINKTRENIPVALVISGDAFAFALKECKDLLIHVLNCCSAVVCNRATPSQKAAFVGLVKNNMKKVCAAVGDGANDVSMIQQAHVGIGILGKEGSQAAQSADIVVHQFRFLTRLFLVHGRYAYNRVCKVVYWSFFKQFLWCTPMFLFQFWNSWTSQTFYDSLSLTWFNSFYTFLPPIYMGIFEKDLPEKLVVAFPGALKPFREFGAFTVLKFARWCMFGIAVGLVQYFVPYGVFIVNDVLTKDGQNGGLWVLGYWVSLPAVVLAHGVFLMNLRNWRKGFFAAFLIDVALYCISFPVIKLLPGTFGEFYGAWQKSFSGPLFWIHLVLVVAVAVVPVVIHRLVTQGRDELPWIKKFKELQGISLQSAKKDSKKANESQIQMAS